MREDHDTVGLVKMARTRTVPSTERGEGGRLAGTAPDASPAQPRQGGGRTRWRAFIASPCGRSVGA